MVVRQLPQPPEHVREELEHAQRLAEQRVGCIAKPEMLRLPLALEGLDGERVELTHDHRLPEAIAENRLAIEDFAGIGEAREEDLLGEVAEILVATRHRVKERLQLQILLQRLGVRRQGQLKIEVPIGVKQVRLHRTIRLLSRS